MKRILFFAIVFTSSAWLSAQKNDLAVKYAESITEDKLFDHLNILASDALEGRETGERGQKMAAAFISSHFESLGLEAPVRMGERASYYQTVPLVATQMTKATLTIKKKKRDNFDDIILIGKQNTQGEISSEVVFVGDGSEESYVGLDVKDKTVLIFSENVFKTTKALAKFADTKGAKFAIIVRTPTDELLNKLIGSYSRYLAGERMSLGAPENSTMLGMVFIAPSMLPDLTGKSYEKLNKVIADFSSGNKNALKKVKPASIKFEIGKESRTFNSENVLGYLEGTDLKDEVVVLTAHYDHLGIRGDKIFNGADDDGSGTAAIMSIATALAQAKAEGNGPRRSVLFIAFTGEEKGLLGSEYYADHPVYPLTNTVTDLNLDMIGRYDEENHQGKDYVCLVGSDKLSKELHEISEQANKTYTQLELNYVYNDEKHPEQIYYRSDHWNFAKNGIPVIFYTTGSHADYHQESDTVDKIESAVYLKRTHLVFYTAWEILNRDNRPKVDVVAD